MRSRIAIGAAALAAAALALGSWSAEHSGSGGTTAAGSVFTTPIRANVDDLAAHPDGSLALALSNGTGGVQLGQIDPDGQQLPSLPLATPPLSGEGSVALRALTPGGGLAAITWQRPGTRGRLTLSELGPDGAPLAPTPIPSWGTTGDPDQLQVGPTRAMAVIGPSAVYGQRNPRVVFRPAGAPVFGHALRIDPTLEARRRKDRFTLDQTRDYQMALGPDGGGAVLVSPGYVPATRPYLRRISPTGRLGPPIRIAPPDDGASDLTMRMAFGPSGTLVVALVAIDSYAVGDGAETDDIHDDALYLTTLPPGAVRTTQVRRLDHGTQDVKDGDQSFRGHLDLAVGPGDRVLLTAQRDHTGPGVYEGSPTSAKRTAILRTAMNALQGRYFGVVGADGSATVLAVARADTGANVVAATHHRPGERFARDRPVTPGHAFWIPCRPVALPNGDVAVPVFYDYGNRSATAIQRVRF